MPFDNNGDLYDGQGECSECSETDCDGDCDNECPECNSVFCEGDCE